MVPGGIRFTRDSVNSTEKGSSPFLTSILGDDTNYAMARPRRYRFGPQNEKNARSNK